MARLPRLAAAGEIHHIVQQASPGLPVFLDDEDRRAFVAALALEAQAARVAIHAYALLDDQVRLLATPQTETGLSRCMQAVGRRHAQQLRSRHGRTGALWAGRFRASVIEAGPYLLPSMVLIDLSPVRAGLAARPADFAWSSHAHYIGLRIDPVLTAPQEYWQLGNTPFAREAAYGAQVDAGLSAQRWQEIADAAWHGWALGSPEFVAALEERLQRRVRPGRPGRPRARKAGM